MQAELYRANDIENYDTATLRIRTADQVEILFYTSHAAHERSGPQSRYEFQNAVVEYDNSSGGQFVARFNDGRVKHYGHPNRDRHEKIWEAISAVRTKMPVACGVATALPHAICVAAAQESAGQIVDFPQHSRRLVTCDDDQLIAIDGLGDQLAECYKQGVLPSEHAKVPWARAGKVLDLRQGDGVPKPQVTVAVHTTGDSVPWQPVISH
jgi:hypothetical protein